MGKAIASSNPGKAWRERWTNSTGGNCTAKGSNFVKLGHGLDPPLVVVALGLDPNLAVGLNVAPNPVADRRVALNPRRNAKKRKRGQKADPGANLRLRKPTRINLRADLRPRKGANLGASPRLRKATGASRGARLRQRKATGVNRGASLQRRRATEANRGASLQRRGATEANRGASLRRRSQRGAVRGVNRQLEKPAIGASPPKEEENLAREADQLLLPNERFHDGYQNTLCLKLSISSYLIIV